MKLNIFASQLHKSTTTNMIYVQAETGVMQILPGHEPYLSSIKNSTINISCIEQNSASRSLSTEIFIYQGVLHIDREVNIYCKYASMINDKTLENTKNEIERIKHMTNLTLIQKIHYDYYQKYLIALLKSCA